MFNASSDLPASEKKQEVFNPGEGPSVRLLKQRFESSKLLIKPLEGEQVSQLKSLTASQRSSPISSLQDDSPKPSTTPRGYLSISRPPDVSPKPLTVPGWYSSISPPPVVSPKPSTTPGASSSIFPPSDVSPKSSTDKGGFFSPSTTPDVSECLIFRPSRRFSIALYPDVSPKPSTAPLRPLSIAMYPETKGPNISYAHSFESLRDTLQQAMGVLKDSINPEAPQPQLTTNNPFVFPLMDLGPHMQYHLPYCWQLFNGTNWENLSDMEDIEGAYSEPGIDNYESINFQTMTTGAQEVRRLCNPDFQLTTEWIWYWKDESDVWIEYGEPNGANERASIHSLYLENSYLHDGTGTVSFTVGTEDYVVNFQEMKQKNTFSEADKEVRRRPKFLKGKNVNMVKESIDFLLQTKQYPTHWDMKAVPKSGYQKVLIPEDSSEFSNVAGMFNKTVQDHTVKKVWRVQNPDLWQSYKLKKDQITNRNLDMNKAELQLFHGTDGANVDAICTEGFDWRICGSNGTLYGQGSYFARDASYSHLYTSPSPPGIRTMFVARVLVGDFINGDSTMRRPPQKCNSSQKYDSCVDNVDNASIFVVFERCHAYPEYILEYKKDEHVDKDDLYETMSSTLNLNRFMSLYDDDDDDDDDLYG